MKQWLMGVSCLGLMACSSGQGNVAFTTYGEDFIEKEIPASAFEDGWTVRYTKFLVKLGELKVANEEGEVAAEQTPAKVYDVHRPGPVSVAAFNDLASEEWDAVSYAIAPSTDATAGNADAEDVTRMNTEGWSVYVEGTATKGAASKRFRWGFPTNTLYERCENEDIGSGVTVPKGSTETVQLTMHGDHLFFDDLQSPDAKMRFDAIAAADSAGVVGPDGEVTLDELGLVDLTTLPSNQYGTGGAGSVRTLRDFVTALVRTVGHYRGEGECSPRVR
ncbi:hypothetical protein OV208_06400 [Corallococcus sp. bb12-1]|uniref:hypothetical protein n=1 Tax=Corallococcus sp. bb12-1 TaxID=2996784 RepID=UPI0022707FF2|nr:hypothetical protein [Corallococcus sp. bb12-1]MCY1040946.1 hypothetical protein [Corallococcus sp. bb12-1]